MKVSDGLRSVRRWTLIVLLALVPIAFNTDTFDVFNLTKFTIVLLGAIGVLGLWIVESVQRRKFLWPRTGIEPAFLALLAVVVGSSALSFSKYVAVFGFYKSYDGLISILAFTILALAASEVFDARHQIRAALISMAVVGGGFATFYGVLQYVTFATEGKIKLDWEQWGVASFKTSAIFSTFGNPNHLAGFLVMVIPVAIGLGVFAKSLAWKIATWAFVGLAFVEILQVQTRGAWVALIFVGGGLVAVFWPEIRRNPLPAIAVVVAALLTFGVAGLVLRGRGNIFQRATSVATADDSSGRQRILLWQSGLEASADKPILGWGPDTFRVPFLRYQGYPFFAKYGPTQVANGPHNIFISWLYSDGLVGLGIFIWLLVAVFRRAIKGARSALSVERDPPKRDRALVVERARDDRVIIGTTAVAIIAFLIGESFNVNQIGLSFAFWVFSGLIGALALLIKRSEAEIEDQKERAARKKAGKKAPQTQDETDTGKGTKVDSRGTKSSDRAGAKSTGPKSTGAKSTGPKAAKSRQGGQKRARSRGPQREQVRPATWIVAGVLVAVAGVLSWYAVLPYRGDLVYRKAVPASEKAKQYQQQLAQAPNQNPEAVSAVMGAVDEALALAEKSHRVNPIESRYLIDIFEMAQLKAFLLRSGSQQTEFIKRAETALLDGQRLSPQDERFFKSLGDLYNYWGGAYPPPRANATPPDRSKLPGAVEQLHKARVVNPYDYEIEELLMNAGTALSDTAIRVDAGQHGFYLGHGPLTADLAQILVDYGDREGAIALLEMFINRHTNQEAVNKKYAELTGRPAPVVKEPTLPLPSGPPPTQPGVPVPTLPPGLVLPG